MPSENNLIYRAEAARVQGHHQANLKVARNQGQIAIAELPGLPQAELADKMRWWRIWVVTLFSVYKGQANGHVAADYLHEAHDVIQNYYYHTDSWEVAKKLRKDNEGHEYQMAAEMCRDEAKYYLNLMSLTGNSLLLVHALSSLDEAIALSQVDSSVHALATMEQLVLLRSTGKKIDWEIFSWSFDRIVELADQAGGPDRVAASAWTLVKEAVLAGKFSEAQKGMQHLRQATALTGKKWWQYPLKEAANHGLSVSRRLTAGQVDVKQLMIQS